MSKFQFIRLCAVALLIFTAVECAVELVYLPDKLEAVTSFDLQDMTYSLLGITTGSEAIDSVAPTGSTHDLAVESLSTSFAQKSFDLVLSLFLLTCQLLGAIGILISSRESLGRFGRFSIRVWIFFSALALLSTVVPILSSAMNTIDTSLEQKLAEGVDSANESLITEYPIILEVLELLQTADIPQSYFTRIYGLLIIATLLVYAFLAFLAIKMWRDAKKFRYS